MTTSRSTRNRSGSPRGEPARRPAAVFQTLDPAWAMLPVLIATRLYLWWMQPYASEDAYITFRFAGELVSGHGLAYNAGERVMGFTSLPWTLVCALGLLLRVDPVGWTRGLGMGADVLSLWLATRMLSAGFGRAAAWTFAAFFAAWPLLAAASMSGMESSAFLTSILAAAYLADRRHPLTGPVLGLVALMRPEGVASAVLLALRARWRDRWIALAMAVAVWAGLTTYYGSPIPQSLIAKSSMYGTPGPWAGRVWWEWLLPFPLGRYPAAADGVQFLPVAAVLSAAAAAGGRALWLARDSAVARAAAAGALVWLGYAALGVAYFWWYMVVPVAALGLFAAVGLSRIVRGAWIPVAAGSLLAGTWTVAPSLYLGRSQTEANLFAPIADYLVTQALPGQSVMLEPIGMIGFRCPIRVIDEVGLVSPAVARRRLQGPGWYADVVEAERPDWLVVRSEVLSTGVAFAGAGAPFRDGAERDRVLSAYRLVPRPGQQAEGFQIYRRNVGP